jgi:hypothetical protein
MEIQQHQSGVRSHFKINLDRINQRHQPLQQLLVNRMPSISVQRGSVRELHHPAKLISLRARQHVDANPGLQQPRNLPLKPANFRKRANLLLLTHARLPPKSKGMNDHAIIVTNVCQIG